VYLASAGHFDTQHGVSSLQTREGKHRHFHAPEPALINQSIEHILHVLDIVQINLSSANRRTDHDLRAWHQTQETNAQATLVASSTKLMLKVLETNGSEREARRLPGQNTIKTERGPNRTFNDFDFIVLGQELDVERARNLLQYDNLRSHSNDGKLAFSALAIFAAIFLIFCTVATYSF